MNKLDTVLVATDLSDGARLAALRGAMQARAAGARSGVLLHVSPESGLSPEVEQRASAALEQELSALAAQVRDRTGFALEPQLRHGATLEQIALAAGDADLLVIGAQGMHPLRDIAIGSTADRLLRTCPRPVLVVKRRPEAPYREVLVPVDFSADSRAAAALAVQVAPSAQLTLMHAFEVAFERKLRFAGTPDEQIHALRSQARERARADMETMIAELGIARGNVSRLIEHGYPPRIISEAEARAGADLIVIGKHGRSRFEEMLLGSITLHVMAEAGCDVLAVRGA